MLSHYDFVQQLYLYYYGRPADPEGLEFWAEASRGNRDYIIRGFGYSEEYQARYNMLPNTELITGLYQQLFGRAPDQAGLEFYVDMLDKHEATFMDIVMDIANGVQEDTLDHDIIESRLSLAIAITDLLTELGPEKAAEYQFSQLSDQEAIEQYFEGVTDSSDSRFSSVALNDLMIELGVLPAPVSDPQPGVGGNTDNPGPVSDPQPVVVDGNVDNKIKYNWDSITNTLTASILAGDGLGSWVITDAEGNDIDAESSKDGSWVSITLDLQSAYDGENVDFQETTGFDRDERFAYITRTAYSFKFTDVNSDVIEESYYLIINKGLNLLGDALSTDRREMILQGERSGKDGVDIATAGDNSSNRDIWMKTNDDGLEGDRFYAESVKDWLEIGAKDQWVMIDLGVYAEGSEDNPLFLSLNNGSLSALQVVMTAPDGINESNMSFYDINDDLQGTSVILNAMNIALGGGA